MQNNTAIVNTEPNAAPLQLPEETASLIKASIAEEHAEGVSAGTPGP